MTKEERKRAIEDLNRDDLIDLASDSACIIQYINGVKHMIQVDATESKKDMEIQSLRSEMRTRGWIIRFLVLAIFVICAYFLRDTNPMMHWIYFGITGAILIATLIWPSFVQ
jgi:hypothetical protein